MAEARVLRTSEGYENETDYAHVNFDETCAPNVAEIMNNISYPDGENLFDVDSVYGEKLTELTDQLEKVATSLDDYMDATYEVNSDQNIYMGVRNWLLTLVEDKITTQGILRGSKSNFMEDGSESPIEYEWTLAAAAGEVLEEVDCVLPKDYFELAARYIEEGREITLDEAVSNIEAAFPGTITVGVDA